MRDDMNRHPVETERRVHPRFAVPERALVAETGDEFGLPYHLVDISEGGMAFRYLNDDPLSLGAGQMDIYLDRSLQVGRLPVRVVADRQLASDFMPKRRCGVRFGELTSAQQIQLQTFIRCHAGTVL